MTVQVNWKESTLYQLLESHLVSEIPLAPQRKFASIVLLREFSSTAVLTTEGQMLDVEQIRAGREKKELISRVVLQKRKQIAPERRTGRAFNREVGLTTDQCVYLEGMCGECPDCLIYGFAATKGEGSQRSRILTDSGFTIRAYEGIQRSITLNAIHDSHKGGVVGSAFAEREHIRPQVFFPTIETTVDVTPAELIYILRNILTTSRYGAESNRQGTVRNIPVAILFGQTEVMSNLDLTQRIYDQLFKDEDRAQDIPLEREEVQEAALQSLNQAIQSAYLPTKMVYGGELSAFLNDLRALWHDEEGVKQWLQSLQIDHQDYQKRKKAKKK
ncbi:CRISPR-associated protein Csc2 [Seinonella peptonophila]|uniref:CRISPR-associated protein Csc2 n=1 Tax=Seinonella peptonophila TaxID=112248 RepID=A0A1M5B5A5_9BACL|nr:type I-D CRISPR-associated protein Cas7/Csc2 [Seinonella peptonophila]SHF37625.1 CRISPR-associated protein Csc2 [Seinonella peptonophila]